MENDHQRYTDHAALQLKICRALEIPPRGLTYFHAPWFQELTFFNHRLGEIRARSIASVASLALLRAWLMSCLCIASTSSAAVRRAAWPAGAADAATSSAADSAADCAARLAGAARSSSAVGAEPAVTRAARVAGPLCVELLESLAPPLAARARLAARSVGGQGINLLWAFADTSGPALPPGLAGATRGLLAASPRSINSSVTFRVLLWPPGAAGAALVGAGGAAGAAAAAAAIRCSCSSRWCCWIRCSSRRSRSARLASAACRCGLSCSARWLAVG